MIGVTNSDSCAFCDKVLEKYFPNKGKSANRDKEKLQPKRGGDEEQVMRTQGASDPQVAPKQLSGSQVKAKATSLVDEQVLNSLTKSCYWLHSCVSNLPDEKPIEVQLEMAQFHYQVDATTWVSKDDVREFLSRDMLNVSIIHVFMR